ncbi:MAG: hypothetical protein ABW034_02730 [Steroidobacteraceae bacterium]
MGAACKNAIRVRKTLVESRVLDSVKADLRDPQIIAEVEKPVRRALAARPSKPDASKKRAAQLEKEIANLADAIVGGLLKASLAL